MAERVVEALEVELLGPLLGPGACLACYPRPTTHSRIGLTTNYPPLYPTNTMLIPNLLLVFGATTALAAPALTDASQLRLGGAGQAALNWGAGAVSRVGSDGGVEANTVWSWTNCGKPLPSIWLKRWIQVAGDGRRGWLVVVVGFGG